MTDVTHSICTESGNPADTSPGDWVLQAGRLFIRTDAQPGLQFVSVRTGEVFTFETTVNVRRLQRVEIHGE